MEVDSNTIFILIMFFIGQQLYRDYTDYRRKNYLLKCFDCGIKYVNTIANVAETYHIGEILSSFKTFSEKIDTVSENIGNIANNMPSRSE
tara:strand:+ start:101 stop:370 length:270 start_codon:yes stop_codon:yes gene_type:complete